ncbi:hypothetical protein HPB49_007709 [Dermacentor silvarum]|uniref:Uncharacterized protein n=1 Tax=Dermacentor silvarum TaxID=543639 RepID=A0ACB8CQD3_DERSI|nr:hypothetical protein HPB49_007709 [Dermacentor silvarum]
MQTDQLIREHELRQRDLMIVRYDRQRLLCDEIIGKQKVLIDAQATRELNELYRIYQQEIQDLSTGRDSVMKHLNVNPYRPNSVLGLRPLGSSESMWDLSHMEPLREEDDRVDPQGVPLSSATQGSVAHCLSQLVRIRTFSLQLTNYVSHREDIEESTRRISSLAAQRRFLRTAERSRSQWTESTSPGTPQMRCFAPASCELSAAAPGGGLYRPGLRRPPSGKAPTAASRCKTYSDSTWNAEQCVRGDAVTSALDESYSILLDESCRF